VGDGAIESILEARRAGGDFRSLHDFAARIDGRRVNRRVVESLVKCGAFDSLHPNRASVWNGLDAALEAGAAVQRDREIGQASLFGGGSGGSAAPEPELPAAPEWTERQRLEHEKEVLGFYVTGHPLSALAPLLKRYADTSSSSSGDRDGREVRVGGILTSLRQTRTRRGALMAFGTLEDLEGSFDLVIFAEPFAQFGSLLRTALGEAGEQGPVPLLVTGKLEQGETPKVLVSQVLELERAPERLSSRLCVRMLADEASADRLSALRGVLQKYPGECEVALHLVIPGQSETVLALSSLRGVRPTAALRDEVDGLFGRSVTELAV
jgi:DNA polymerase-3 subunit alpha